MNISQILNKLKATDIKDLRFQKERLKDFNFTQPFPVIITALFIFTLFLSFQIFHRLSAKTADIASQLPALREKISLLKENKELTDEERKLKESFPPTMNADQVLNMVYALASKYHAQILAVSPAKATSFNEIVKSSFSIDVSSSDYRNLVLFIRDMEQTSYAIRIQKWLGRLENQRTHKISNQSNVEDTIVAKMEIEALELKK